MLTLTISRLTSLTSDVPHGDTSPGRCLFSSAPSSPRPCITQSPSTLSCVNQIFERSSLDWFRECVLYKNNYKKN